VGVVDLIEGQLASVLYDIRFSVMPVGDGSTYFFPELEIASGGQTGPLQLHPYDQMS